MTDGTDGTRRAVEVGRRNGKTRMQADALVAALERDLPTRVSVHSSPHHSSTRLSLMDDVEWDVTALDDGWVGLRGSLSEAPDEVFVSVILGRRVLDQIAERLGLSRADAAPSP